MLTPRAVTALVDLIHALRPEWQTAGIRAAIRACEHGDPYTIAQAFIRRASNPANRTPQLQPHDFDVTPAARQTCTRNGCWPHGRCAGCLLASGAMHDANTCDAPPPFVVVRAEESVCTARAVGRFNAAGPDGYRAASLPDGYRAASLPDGPVRATRAEAETDQCDALHRDGDT